jgi:hypothetical protein
LAMMLCARRCCNLIFTEIMYSDRPYGVHNNANWCCAPGNENLEDDRVIFLVICNDLQCATNPQSQSFSNRERMLAPPIGRNLT